MKENQPVKCAYGTNTTTARLAVYHSPNRFEICFLNTIKYCRSTLIDLTFSLCFPSLFPTSHIPHSSKNIFSSNKQLRINDKLHANKSKRLNRKKVNDCCVKRALSFGFLKLFKLFIIFTFFVDFDYLLIECMCVI